MPKKIRLGILAIAASIGLVAITAEAQITNTPNLLPPAGWGGLSIPTVAINTTNAPAAPGGVFATLDTLLAGVGLSRPTNMAFAPFVAFSTKNHEIGAGVVAVENVNQHVGVAIGVDHLWYGGKFGSANIVSGGLSLSASEAPLNYFGMTNSFASGLILTEYALALVGTPMSGTGGNDGGLCAINRAGLLLDLYHTGSWVFSAGIDYGNRTGAGRYSGNWIDIPFTARYNF